MPGEGQESRASDRAFLWYEYVLVIEPVFRHQEVKK